MPSVDLAHESGNHCGSTSLRDLSRFYGWGFDEPTCFGLGSGLGFSYIRQPDPPERLFFGRTNWLEWAFFEHLGIDHTVHEGASFPDAWDAITDRIDGGDPVMIFTDLYYLDYYDSSTHFSPHSLLVVGYDDDHAHLADSEFDTIQELPLDRLEAAMTTDYVVPLECRYLTVDGAEIGANVTEAAAAAMHETATFMLDPAAASRSTRDFGAQGIPAMRQFARDLPTWDALEDPSWAARFAYENVERRGTGGGAFRRMYADFLEGVADRVPIPDDAAERMAAIADDWTAAGDSLRQASEAADEATLRARLETAGEQVETLAHREATRYRDLRDHT